MSFMASAYQFIAPYVAQVPVHFTPFGAIAAMLGLIFASKFVHVMTVVTTTGKYDNVHPRHGNGSEAATKNGLVQRALGAHQNTIEAFCLFSVAVIMGVVAKMDSTHLAQLCNAFLAVRVAYVFVYVIAANDALAGVRSAVWMLGVLMTVRIMTQAIEAMQ